jgi:hypothetical protein
VSERRYSEEEVQEILSRALEKQGLDASTTSHEELRRAAEEVGISREDFEAAAGELGQKDEQRKMSADYRAWLRRRRRGWFRHFSIYLVVCAFIVALDLFTAPFSGGFHWSFFPIAGWGLGVVLHLLAVIFSRDEQEWIERELRRRQWSKRWRERRKKFERGSAAFEQIVTAGVDAFVKALGEQQRSQGQGGARVRVEPSSRGAKRRVEGERLEDDDEDAADLQKRVRK